tara:strand:+ start:2122 stop:2763 length:642 start_codon:yes stop_codon:yes gene_type:complete
MRIDYDGKESEINNFTFGEEVLFFDCSISVDAGEYITIFPSEEDSAIALIEACRKVNKTYRTRARIHPEDVELITKSIDFNARNHHRVVPCEKDPVSIKMENIQQLWEYNGIAEDISHGGLSVILPPLYEEAGAIDFKDELNVVIKLPTLPEELIFSGHFKHECRVDNGRKYGVFLFHHDRFIEKLLYERLSQYVFQRQREELQKKKREKLKT